MSTKLTEMRSRPKLPNDGPVINREKAIVAMMIAKYCKGKQHLRSHEVNNGKSGSGARNEMCTACRELLAYARLRLDHCRFGEAKRTCARCPVHCYKRDRRSEIKAVMRYAGPRMLWSHPFAVLQHALDGLSWGRSR